jgi:hypothetical protein
MKVYDRIEENIYFKIQGFYIPCIVENVNQTTKKAIVTLTKDNKFRDKNKPFNGSLHYLFFKNHFNEYQNFTGQSTTYVSPKDNRGGYHHTTRATKLNYAERKIKN